MYKRCARVALSVLARVSITALAACTRSAPAKALATPSTASPAAGDLPETNASRVIQPAEGGIVALKDGTEISIPSGALSDTTVVGLSVVEASPKVPVPRSLIGRAVQFGLDGGSMTGVARIRLPLPSAITADQYEVAAYRWDGKAWERIFGRINRNALEFGTNAPAGIFAVQGQWRLADAEIGLTVSAGEPGQATASIAIAGQYHYSALPVLQGEYVPARLILKLDTSGGIGQITGDDSADRTVSEALLWFKPDPAQVQGVIPFSHVFEIAPAQLDVPPGTARSLYAVLNVDDSPAATRRASNAADYTQILPIRVTQTEKESGGQKKIVTEVIRPALPQEPPPGLRWHVRFNGLTMAQIPATQTTLALDEYLALGGLGAYSISLETDVAGKSHTVSNEIPIILAVPGTPTPMPTATPVAGAASATPGPVIGTPTPGGPAPATPTRRTPPGESTPTPTPGSVATATRAPTATPTRPSWASVFWADRYIIAPGECTTLHWNVENVISVYLDEKAVTGDETRQVCPTATTTYTLSVTSTSGQQSYHLPVSVQEEGEPAVVFYADTSTIVTGQCTLLHWETSDVSAVYLNDAGVAGVAVQQVCPEATTTYQLKVVQSSTTSITKSITIKVLTAERIAMSFWADQYALATGKCTNLHWSVENVSAVYLQKTGGEEGVAGVGSTQACPTGPSQFYALRAQTSDGRTETRRLTLKIFDPTTPNLMANEVIAQGIVRDVLAVTDADPATAGDQPGFQVVIDGIYPLFRGSGDCCQAMVGLQLTQVLTGDNMAEVVDWPVNPGQFVEFRGTCTNATCTTPVTRPFYLKLRSR